MPERHFPTKELLSATADVLRKRAGSSKDHEFMRISSDVLMALALEDGTYERNIRTCNRFVEELKDLCGKIIDSPDNAALYENSFSLVECLALISKELSLRLAPCAGVPSQKALLQYFETCGHWKPDDNTIVSHYYFTLLPLENRQ